MKYLILFLLTITVLSCSDNPTQSEDTNKKYYSGENPIDLNSDGQNDVRWELRYIGNKTTTDAMFTVWPINGSELLYSSQYGNPLFVKGDTIKFNVIQPLHWYSLPLDLASKRTNTGQWQGNWTGKTSYMAIKISFNNNFHCGWVNVTMDTINEKIIFNYSDYQNNSGEDFIIKD
ncbi:MAG: hypothetical protein STSR0008_26380 [Ignavibacterium sp.]